MNKLKTKRIGFFSILVTFLLFIGGVVFFGLFFRKIRDMLPPPQINQTKIVGYTQYFGYPFFLDTVIFFLFLLFPFIIFSLLYLLKKKSKK